jgi:hypothetical protein
VTAKWGSERVHDQDRNETYSVLDMIIIRYGGSLERFNNLVAAEYIKFLIVKCVEMIAINNNKSDDAKDNSTITQSWRSKCQPNEVVDMFWKAHVSCAEKYALDCHVLFGELLGDSSNAIIERNVSAHTRYDGPNYEYSEKRDFLFQFENNLPVRNFFFGRFGGRHNKKDTKELLSEDFNVYQVARSVWNNMKTREEFVRSRVDDEE